MWILYITSVQIVQSSGVQIVQYSGVQIVQYSGVQIDQYCSEQTVQYSSLHSGLSDVLLNCTEYSLWHYSVHYWRENCKVWYGGTALEVHCTTPVIFTSVSPFKICSKEVE